MDLRNAFEVFLGSFEITNTLCLVAFDHLERSGLPSDASQPPTSFVVVPCVVAPLPP